MSNSKKQPRGVDDSGSSVCYLAFCWDSFRWRFVAAYYLVWWLFQGLPMADQPEPTRLANAKWAWSVHRSTIMRPHEKHNYLSIDEILEELREREAV